MFLQGGLGCASHAMRARTGSSLGRSRGNLDVPRPKRRAAFAPLPPKDDRERALPATPSGSGRPRRSHGFAPGQRHAESTRSPRRRRNGWRCGARPCAWPGTSIAASRPSPATPSTPRCAWCAPGRRASSRSSARRTAWRERYERYCASCHGDGDGDGDGGEGNAQRFYPRVSGQHYQYLLRESIDIRDGVRLNANPKMVTIVKRFSNADLAALADYMSRLPVAPPAPAR